MTESDPRRSLAASAFRNTVGRSLLARFKRGMRKTQLVDRLAAEYPHLGSEGARQVVETILGNIDTALGQGRRVELRGFGIFTPRVLAERAARNPRTGEAVTAPAITSTMFRAGKRLHERLNGSVRSD